MQKTTLRKIKKIVPGMQTVDGAGVHLHRIFGNKDVEDFDPFLLLDAFDSKNPEDYIKGFPWHPHRGIETITYLIEGEIDHGDNLGNSGVIASGDCQWMTAGAGIIHQEMPQASRRLFGTQLWLNLAAKNKMVTPQYHDIKAGLVPAVQNDGCLVKIIGGTYQGQTGAMTSEYAETLYLDVDIPAGKEWSLELDRDDTLFVYILQGAGSFVGDQSDLIFEKQAVLFEKGEKMTVRAGLNGMRFLLLSGKPLREPIAWGGPIVMNTQEELDLAFQELDEGTFIKK